MYKLLVSGLINVETTLRVDAFPLEYKSVRYPFWGIKSSVSGVGFNLAKALTVLGNSVSFLSLIADDEIGMMVRRALAHLGVSQTMILSELAETPQSVVIYEQSGRRQVLVDLKDIQERPYPPDLFLQALSDCSLAMLCNVNFNRPFLQKAKKAGKLVATDVHTIQGLEDEYNVDFMAAADILFMSGEKLPERPEVWARRVQKKFGTSILVIGLGEEGALLAVKDDNFVERVTAVQTRPVINTIGAGDALFSAFNHVYHQTKDPYQAIQKATLFASYKIGTAGAADGFLTEEELDKLAQSISGESF